MGMGLLLGKMGVLPKLLIQLWLQEQCDFAQKYDVYSIQLY